MTFTFKPRPGGRIRAELGESGGQPHVWFHVASKEARTAAVFIPLDRVEEVIAGIRAAARQAGGRANPNCAGSCPGCYAGPAPVSAPRQLSEQEHTAAWHAIEGTAGQDGADAGTVLTAVLNALSIDPPAAQALASTTAAPPPGCPAKHGAYGRVCELADGHTGVHRGSIPGGHVSWHGDADGWE
jgi:hypothetical protein